MNWSPYCSKFLMEKTQVLFLSNRNDNRICQFNCSTISLWQWLNSSSFAFVNPISNLGLGDGICDILLACSKTLRKSPKLSSRASGSFLEMLTPSLRINRCCNFESQKWSTLNAEDFLLDPLLELFGGGTVKCPKCCDKSNYLRLFRPKLLLVFLHILNKVCTS